MTPPEGEVVEGDEQADLDPAIAVKELAKARRDAAAYRTKLREAEARLTEQEKASMTENERAIAEAKEEGAAEVRAAVAAEMFQMRVKTLASPVLRDADDAVRFITDLPHDSDEDAIKSAIGALLKEKPYLAVDHAPSQPIAQGQRSDGVGGADANDWLRSTIQNR